MAHTCTNPYCGRETPNLRPRCRICGSRLNWQNESHDCINVNTWQEKISSADDAFVKMCWTAVENESPFNPQAVVALLKRIEWDALKLQQYQRVLAADKEIINKLHTRLQKVRSTIDD